MSRELAAGLHAELREVLEPLLKEIESLNERIQEYDVRVEKIAKESYPQFFGRRPPVPNQGLAPLTREGYAPKLPPARQIQVTENGAKQMSP